MPALKLNSYRFSIFSLLILCAILIPDLLQDGMFMDGVIYSTVAKNLANGEGTFWNLHLCSSLLDRYRDQPPLTIWIISFFFKAFGNSMYVERIYSFLTSIICVYGISVIWKIYFQDNDKRHLSWLPSLLFIITPIVFWSFRNNMEENTMLIFILGSIIFYLRGLFLRKDVVLNSIVAGTLIFCGMMCKGLQGSFVLVFPLIYLFVYFPLNSRKGIISFLISLAVILGLLSLLYCYDPSRKYFTEYFNARLVSTFTNSLTSTTTNRLFLLYRLICELIPALFMLIILFFTGKRIMRIHNLKNINPDLKGSLLFILTGLSGSLPLLITLEQRSFYIVPALPFFIIGITIMLAEYIWIFFQQVSINKKVFRIICFISVAITGIMTIKNIGKSRRDTELLEDVYSVGKFLPRGSSICTSYDEYENWSLYLYFKRYFDDDIIITQKKEDVHSFLLKSNSDRSEIPEDFYTSPLHLNNFILYLPRDYKAEK